MIVRPRTALENENLHCIKSINKGMIKTAIIRTKDSSKIFIQNCNRWFLCHLKTGKQRKWLSALR